VIKAEEAATLYNLIRKSQVHNIDHEVQPKDWLHPADSVKITEQKDEHAIQIYTDGSKSEHGVGARVAIFIQNKLAHHLRFALHNKCSNNQAEQLAIVKALETIEKLQMNENIPTKVTVYTDSRIKLQSLKNTKNHSYLIDEIRKKAITLENHNWRILFTWIKAHAGNYGNNLADKLAKEAASKEYISFNRIPKSEIAQQLRDTAHCTSHIHTYRVLENVGLKFYQCQWKKIISSSSHHRHRFCRS
jgi:ribonuclease HI